MTPLLSIVLLTLIAYLSSRLGQSLRSGNIWLKSISYSGSLYLLLGYLLGPGGLNYIDKSVSDQLQVILALVLTWAGFLVGLQTKASAMLRFPWAYYRTATANFLLTLMFLFLILIPVISFIQMNFLMVEILALALAGSVTSPIMLGLVIREFPVKSTLSHLLQFLSAYDNILGIIVLGFIAAFHNSVSFLAILQPGLAIILIPILISGLSAYFFSKLAQVIKSEQEMFLLIIGFLIYIAGIALYLNLSLLFAGFIFGLVISNLKTDDKKIKHAIHDVEKPFYIILLIFVGINIPVIQLEQTILLCLFIFIHMAANYIAGYLAMYRLNKHYHRHTRKNIGLSNIGMGGMAVAIILDSHLLISSTTTYALIYIIAVAVILNDLLALDFLRRSLVRNEKKLRSS
jgi:Kef-type K+ transport system membrane component KefB